MYKLWKIKSYKKYNEISKFLDFVLINNHATTFAKTVAQYYFFKLCYKESIRIGNAVVKKYMENIRKNTHRIEYAQTSYIKKSLYFKILINRQNQKHMN